MESGKRWRCILRAGKTRGELCGCIIPAWIRFRTEEVDKDRKLGEPLK